jgi:hypothetical protein
MNSRRGNWDAGSVSVTDASRAFPTTVVSLTWTSLGRMQRNTRAWCVPINVQLQAPRVGRPSGTQGFGPVALLGSREFVSAATCLAGAPFSWSEVST